MTGDLVRDVKTACQELIVALVHAQDHADAEGAAALFVEDGVWIRSGKPHRGRAAIVASFATAQSRVVRHITSSTRVEVETPERARAVTYYLAYVAPAGDGGVAPLGPPASLGEWHDRFVLTDSGWRFSHREGRRVFER